MLKIKRDQKQKFYLKDLEVTEYRTIKLEDKNYFIDIDIKRSNSKVFYIDITFMNRSDGSEEGKINYKLYTDGLGKRDIKNTMNDFLIISIQDFLNKTDSKKLNQKIYNFIKEEL